MDESFDVVVVGGGIAGLVLALLLEERGALVAILERQPKIIPLPRAELLQPNALRILDRLGVIEPLRNAGAQSVRAFHFLSESGERLCTIDYERLSPPHNIPLNAEPHRLHRLLEERVRSRPRIRLIWGASFMGLIRENGRLSGIAASVDGRTARIGCRVVVGADGALSSVRDALAIPAETHVYRHAYLTMVVARPGDFAAAGRYTLGPETILGLFPLAEGKLYVFYLFRREDREHLIARGIDEIKERMIRMDPSIAGPLTEITTWSQVGFRPVIRVRAGHWVIDRAVLMGDAAHAMNPHVAQGRNQGLEDAALLADILAQGLAEDDLRASSLRRYEKIRRPWVEALQREGDFLTWLWNSGNPLTVRLRERIFRTVDQNSVLKGKILSQVAGLSPVGFSPFDRIVALGLFPDPRL